MQAGAIPPDDPLPIQRDLLKLKRQLAALDAGLPVSMAATETTAPAASSEADEVRRIQALIKDSPDLINAPDQKGETLLQSAAAKGKLAVVKLLLDSGAAVDGLQQPGLTALHYAAANGHKAIVDLLLSKGAKADAQTEGGVTPLHLAARKGYEAVAKALLAAGASVNAQPRRRSQRYRRLAIPSSPAKPRSIWPPTPVTPAWSICSWPKARMRMPRTQGRTPLSYAAERHYEPVCNPAGGPCQSERRPPNLPLAVAAGSGDMAALKLLLANGADPNTNSVVDWHVNKGVRWYEAA